MSSKPRSRAAVGRRPTSGRRKGRQQESVEGVAKEVTRLLDEIRSVDVEWPVVQPADEHGSRVERLRREEERLAGELRAMEAERTGLQREQESVEEQKRGAAPYQEDVTELKAEIRRLQGVVANEALAQETVDLLTEEQELLATQFGQAEHRSLVLVAKAEELASLVLEVAEGSAKLGKDSLEAELKRVVAEAEAAHDTVDALKATAAEQKQALARAQIELVEAKEAAKQAQVELKDGHHELLIASREAADMVSAARKRQENLLLRMDELQDRELQVGAKKVKVAERIKAELKAIAEAKAVSMQAQEEEAEEMVRLAQEAKEERRREELARAATVRDKQKRASSGIPAPAYQAPSHTPRRKPGAGATPKRQPADAQGSPSPSALRQVPSSPATRIPLAAALEAAAHEEFVPKTPGAQAVKAHLDEAKAIDSPRTPSRQKLPQRLAGSASATPSRQNLPSRLSTAKKPALKGGAGSAHATGGSAGPQLVMPDHEARDVLFDSIDINGNGGLSLAEIDKAVVSGFLGKAMHCPDFDHKPALMRAYQAADVSHDGFIQRSEFMKLLQYLVYFNNLWHRLLGIELSPKQARAEFKRCDTDGGGMILFGEFCKWAADRHMESDVACMSQSEAESARRADEEAAIQKHKEAEFAHLTRIERRRQDLAARAEAIEPKQKRVDVSQKRVKEEREVLERQRMVLRRQNAALLKEQRRLREEQKEITKAQEKLRKLRENKDKLQKASQAQTKDTKLQARQVKEKLAKLEQAEELQSSLVAEEHAQLDEEMARLREARVRFHAERREAEAGLRAACEAAGVEWTMEPLPTSEEQEALAAAQKAEMEERNSRLEALLTVASAPTAQGGAESEDIDYDEDDDEGDVRLALGGRSANQSQQPTDSTADGDDINYDEEDEEGSTDDDEMAISEAVPGLPDSSTAAAGPLGQPPARAAPLLNSDSDSSTDDDNDLSEAHPQTNAPANTRQQPAFNSDSSSEEDV